MLDITNDDHDETRFKIIEEGDWISDHKYQFKDIIFQYEDKFYCLSESRTGSYHTDYYYESEDWPEQVEVPEVEKVEVVKYEWKTI